MPGSPRPPFAPLRTPAIWVYTMFGVYIAATLTNILGTVNLIQVVNDFNAGGSNLQALEDAEELYAGLGGIQAFASFAIIPFFIWWLRRATANVRALGAEDQRYGTGWAVGGWFVPILSFWRPLQIANQAWRASDPSVPRGNSRDWKSLPVSGLLIFWWLSWLGTSVAGGIADAAYGESSLENASAALGAVIATQLGVVAATCVAIWFVRALTSRQAAAANALHEPAAGVPRFDAPASDTLTCLLYTSPSPRDS